ncbi:Chymotrypsinogen B [Galemys pyrenaicus]|uniref:chymotrypsin n=1 Tax=Galemys pyrenaicus TaxID=202257 RepID=A0A8J5ZMZ9_GALPY|nr:Chymotrypsinogen B [Galemys pyrenaicus]
MALLWLLSCFALIGASFGSGAPASDPELSIMPRVINGMDAVTMYPWHVSLEDPSGKLLCGGSLIGQNWVITAANCNIRVYDWVVAGLHDRKKYGNKIQYIKIGKIFRHPEFNLSTLYADVALLKLTTNIGIQRTVAPVALPTADDTFPVGSECKIMGWGTVRHNSRRRPDKLQEATVPILSKARCRQHWGRELPSDMLCIGANGVSCWSGDVGGSLVCKKNGVWTLAGVIIDACSGAPAGDPELSIMPRIINGMDAVTVYPWHVSVEEPSGNLLCGGSLISQNWVITAAHCNIRANDWVVAGLHDRRKYGNKIQYIKISKVIRHPKFNNNTLYADVALLKLTTNIGIQRTVAPVALPTVYDRLGSEGECPDVLLSVSAGRRRPDKLQEATVPILSKARCRQHWGYQLLSDTLCVGANGASSWKVRVLHPAPQIFPSSPLLMES